ncbi:MAG TPA: malto-oligosyltrehalose synthase, partial [Chloroflexi bacterium]|nr:malto-oligosyltrehalose synthase [Chloroflexota bacterium]
MRPTATYRLQLTPAFGFDAAAALVPYLARLGISHLYLSPILKARVGSQHGYDVTDATQINPELGGSEGFDRLCETMAANGLEILLDIVPNHMAASPENAWWWSVLENGQSSEFASFFDIAWYESASGGSLDRKVLLPILGNHYGIVLEALELRVEIDERGFTVVYYDNRMPLDPTTYRLLLEQRYGLLKDRLASDAVALQAYEGLIELSDTMPDRFTTDAPAIQRRREETGLLKQRMWEIYAANDIVRTFVDENLALING